MGGCAENVGDDARSSCSGNFMMYSFCVHQPQLSSLSLQPLLAWSPIEFTIESSQHRVQNGERRFDCGDAAELSPYSHRYFILRPSLALIDVPNRAFQKRKKGPPIFKL